MRKSTNMNIVHSASLHLVNGTTFTTELPDFRGIVFKNDKIKERFKRKKLRELYGENLADVPDDARADILMITVQPPEGITSLPEGWQPDPIEPPRPVVKPVIRQEATQYNQIIPEPFRWNKPKFKYETTKR